jgi:toxic protein SymE
MADANLKSPHAHPERSVTIQESWRYQQITPGRIRKEPPLYPWMKLSGRWIEHAGFLAGQRVRIVVEHHRIIITPFPE